MTTPHDKVHYPATNQAHYCWWEFWIVAVHPWHELRTKVDPLFSFWEAKEWLPIAPPHAWHRSSNSKYVGFSDSLPYRAAEFCSTVKRQSNRLWRLLMIILRTQNMGIIHEHIRMSATRQIFTEHPTQSSPAFPFFICVRRQRYNEYVLCAKKNHGDETTCQQAKQHARSICPDEWVSSHFLT